MSNLVYDHHEKAFERTAAWVLVKNTRKGPRKIGTVSIKYPADGAGRLNAFVHILGGPMVRGSATGGGYDKASAAVSVAARQIDPDDYEWEHDSGALAKLVRKMKPALEKDDGHRWDDALRDACPSVSVFQAV